MVLFLNLLNQTMPLILGKDATNWSSLGSRVPFPLNFPKVSSVLIALVIFGWICNNDSPKVTIFACQISSRTFIPFAKVIVLLPISILI